MANLRSKLANLDLFGPTGSVAPDICACMPCPVLSAFPTSPFLLPPSPLRSTVTRLSRQRFVFGGWCANHRFALRKPRVALRKSHDASAPRFRWVQR